MKKSTRTRASLLSSVIALTICFAMLLGTTFAWFTDTAATGVNKIQAGNLDIQLLEDDGETSLEGETLAFQKAAGAVGEDVLWEPGATYYTQGFQIKNGGDLYLKFNLIVNGVTGGSNKLLEVIKFYIATEEPVQGEMPDSAMPLDTFAGTAYTLAPGKYYDGSTEGSANAKTMYLVGHMDENAGNEYQGLSIDGVGITLNATQKDAESDSFGNQYDVDATIPLSSSVKGNLDVTTTTDGGTTTVTVKTSTTIADSTMSVTYPAEVKLNPATEVSGTDDQQKAAVTQELKYVGSTLSADAAGVTLADGQSVASYTLTLPVDENNNTYLVPVTIKYTKDLDGVMVYHNGKPLATAEAVPAAEYFTYRPDTGELVLNLFHASPIDIVFDTNGATVSTEDGLRAALADETAKSIYLTESIELAKQLTISRAVNIIGNGNTISNQPITVTANVKFENVTLSKPTSKNNNASLVYAYDGCESLIFDGVTFTDPQWEAIQATSNDLKTLTITNCTFTAAHVDSSSEKGYGSAADEAIRFIHVQPSRKPFVNITITGNTFENCDKVKDSVVGIYFVAEGSTLTIGKNGFSGWGTGEDTDGYAGKLSVSYPEMEELKEIAKWTGDISTFAYR